MDQFIGKLQKEDKRNLLLTRNFRWIMWSLAILYAIMFIVRPFSTNTIYEHIGWSLYVLTFVSFGFIFNYLKKEYQQVDYGLPTLKMLENAAKRYKLFQRKVLLASAPVLLLDAGMVLVTFDNENPETLLRTILVTQALIIPAVGIGLIIGISIWRKRQKPLRDNALEMINELNK
jgi:hypothetical protein